MEATAAAVEAPTTTTKSTAMKPPPPPMPPLDEVAPKAYNTFAAGLFGDQTAFAVN
jgi:hypothetical protein